MILPPAPSDFRTLQRILLVLLVAIASIVLVTLLWNVGERFSQAVLVVFVGWVLAIVISPVVQSMNRRFRIPMALGVVLLYVVGLLIGGGVAVILIPLLVNQLEQLAAAIPRLEQDLLNAVGVVSVPLENLGISLTDALDFQSIARQGGQLLLTTSGALLGLLGNLLGGLFNLVLILTIAFYSVLDRAAWSGVPCASSPRTPGRTPASSCAAPRRSSVASCGARWSRPSSTPSPPSW